MIYQVFILKFQQIKPTRQKQLKKFFDKISKQLLPSEKKLFIENNKKDNTYNIDEE